MVSVLDVSDVHFDHQVECIVIGAGACGLVCALRLCEAGLTPLVLERDSSATGSTSMSSGFIPAAGTQQQLRQGITDSVEQFTQDIQKKAANEADPNIVSAVTLHCAHAIDWLEQVYGFNWHVLDDFLYPGHSAYRMHTLPGKTGADLQQRLLSTCLENGVDVVTDARVDALVVQRDSNGFAIRGVRIQRPNGQLETLQSEKTLLACNGYGANSELMQRYIPEMQNAFYYGHCGNMGDAMQWAEQLELPLRHMSAYQGHGSLATGHNILITWALMMQGGIQVNKHGLRFSNEHGGYSEQAVHVLRQTGPFVWNIYDKRIHDLGATFPDYQQAMQANAILEADSIEALARKIKVPASNLTATLSHISQLASQNKPDEFGRKIDREAVLEKPFYAVKVSAAVFHTQGGLVIDDQARVLDSYGDIVPNLLAAGGAACGVSGSKVQGYLSGNGLLTAVGLGFIAANTIIGNRPESNV